MYRHLNAQRIATTVERLGRRVEERFPGSGLSRVSRELLDVAREHEAQVARILRPNWLVRAGVGIVVLALVAVVVGAALSLRVSVNVDRITDLLQTLDAAVNEIILLALALFFLVSLEGRLKRRQALRALHQLRSIAHVIDMHQLSKDPEAILSPTMATASSPHRTMTRFQLSRYLDYCAEMLSLTSKLAALHVQYGRDPVVMSAVSDIENLTAGLSQKIWQKITILDTELAKEPPVVSQGPPD